MVMEALQEYLRRHDREALQRLAVKATERMNEADRKEPDYKDYLKGDEDAWDESDRERR